MLTFVADVVDEVAFAKAALSASLKVYSVAPATAGHEMSKVVPVATFAGAATCGAPGLAQFGPEVVNDHTGPDGELPALLVACTLQ